MFSSGMTYQRARTLLLLTGLIVVGLVAWTMLLRGVDPVETSATLFFAPIFAGLLYLGITGGLLLGAAAAVGYVVLRLPAIDLVGFSTLSGLVLSRVIGYLAFGLVGGWAISQLKGAIEKLELYDAIDDETGLGNARSVVDVLDTERSRAERYAKIFSVVTATFEMDGNGRQERTRLKALGTQLAAGVRDSDHAAHARDGSRHWLVVILPETGNEGATTVSTNLSEKLSAQLGTGVEIHTITFPGNETALEDLLGRFRELDRAARP